VQGVSVPNLGFLSKLNPTCVERESDIQIFLFGIESKTPETGSYIYTASNGKPFILCRVFEIVPVGSVIAAPPGYREPAVSTFGAPAQPSIFGAPAQLGAPPVALTTEYNPNFVFKGDADMNLTGSTDMNLTGSTDINVLKPPVKSPLAGVGKLGKAGVGKLGKAGVGKLKLQQPEVETKAPKAVASLPSTAFPSTASPSTASTSAAFATPAQASTASPSTASPFAAATEAPPAAFGEPAQLTKKNIRKRPEPEKQQSFAQELRRDENIQGSKKQKKDVVELEGGSAIISIPTPSKTRKSHQRKRSQSSNKSTFKRRKYTEE
jgi:hypothetical protein